MSFQGQVDQIPIANIVQALFLNGKEGVLTVENDQLVRQVKVLKLGLRPLLSQPGDLEVLRVAVLKSRLLTETQFQNAMSTWDPSSGLPGEFLLRRRILSTDDVEQSLRKQFEEQLFEILSHKDLRYEFNAGVSGDGLEIFDPDSVGNSLIYSVNGLLMESARREDEWARIEAEIPSPWQILIPVGKGLPSNAPGTVDVAPSLYSEVAPHLTGDRSIHRIIEESSLSRFEVYQVLHQLLKASLVRPLGLAEKESLADRLRKLVKNREAVDVYRSILEERPDDVRARVQLIFLLEKSEDSPRDLVDQYLALVERFAGEEPEKASSYAEKALAHDPNNLVALNRLIVLQAASGDDSSALQTVRSLCRSARRTERCAEGAAYLEEIVKAYPEELFLYHELADMHIAANQNGAAVVALKKAGEIYEERRDFSRLLKTYDLIIRIAPSESANYKRIALRARKERLRPRDLVRLSLFTTVVSSIGAVVIYFLLVDIDSRRVYAETERMVHVHMKHSEFGRARSTLMDFLKSYWFSTSKKTASVLFAEIERIEKNKIEEDTRVQARLSGLLRDRFAEANRLYNENDLVGAKLALTRTIAEISSEEIGVAQEADITAIRSRLDEITAYLDRAGKLSAEAARALGAQEIELAHQLTLELLTQFPNSPDARDARLPVLLDSTPPGARISIQGAALEAVTPVVLSFAPQGKSSITFQLHGYKSTTLLLSPRTTHSMVAKLEKLPIWSFASAGPIDSAPVVDRGSVYFANRDGRVFALNEEGKKRWNEVEVGLDVSGGVSLVRGVLAIANFEGSVQVLDARTGRPVGSPIWTTSERLPVKTRPSEATANGVIVLNCGNRFLAAVQVSADGPTLRWSLPSPSILLGGPQRDGALVRVFTVDGELLTLDPGAPAETALVARTRLRSTMAHAGVIRNSSAFVGSAAGEVIRYSIDESSAVWTTALSSAPIATPTVPADGSRVILSLASGDLVCLDGKDGSVLWRVDVEAASRRLLESPNRVEIGAIESRGAIDQESFVVGTKHGFLLGWNLSTGGLDWIYRAQRPDDAPSRGFSSPGVLLDGRVYQGSDDGVLYCFETR